MATIDNKWQLTEKTTYENTLEILTTIQVVLSLTKYKAWSKIKDELDNVLEIHGTSSYKRDDGSIYKYNHANCFFTQGYRNLDFNITCKELNVSYNLGVVSKSIPDVLSVVNLAIENLKNWIESENSKEIEAKHLWSARKEIEQNFNESGTKEEFKRTKKRILMGLRQLVKEVKLVKV